jgi:hypothetical protein
VGAELVGDGVGRGLPGGEALRGRATPVVEREHQAQQAVVRHVGAHGRLRAARLVRVHDGDDDEVGRLQDAHALDRDQLRVARPHADADERGVPGAS